MLNAKGKPFVKKVNAAAITNDNSRSYNNQSRRNTGGSIVLGALNALNWWTVWMMLLIQTAFCRLIALIIWTFYFLMSYLMLHKK